MLILNTSLHLKKCWNACQEKLGEFYEKLSRSCDWLKENTIVKLESIIREKKESKRLLETEKSKYDKHLKEIKSIAEKRQNDYIGSLERVSKEKTFLFGNNLLRLTVVIFKSINFASIKENLRQFPFFLNIGKILFSKNR